MARYRAPSIPPRINRQSTCGLTALRTWPTSRSRPHEAGSAHITLPLTIATSAMTTTAQWSWTTQRVSITKALTIAHFSDYNNNAFVTFEAPPPPEHKKTAENIKCNNRLAKSGKRATAPSNDNRKAMAYAQPFTASAKVLNKPLAFSLENN
jgi:hypothetical protein